MVMVDEAGRHAMEEANESKIEGIIVMRRVVSDPPKAGGVKAALKTDKERPRWNVSTVARKATRRVSVVKKAPRFG